MYIKLLKGALCLCYCVAAVVFAGVFSINKINKLNMDFNQQYIFQNQNNATVSNASEEFIYDNVEYAKHSSGIISYNILINFINYPNDETNYFTPQEIDNWLTRYHNQMYNYMERMSQGKINICFDYVFSIAPNERSYYQNLNPDLSIERELFNSAVEKKLDYNGNVKKFKFNNYQVRVNKFAGANGMTNTFLWPHTYMESKIPNSNLMLLVEHPYSSDVSYTFLHELLHTFGLSDLYASGRPSFVGAQNIDMMATSNQAYSTNAYYRQKVG